MKKLLSILVALFTCLTGVSAQVEFQRVVVTPDQPATLELGMGVNYIALTPPQDGTLEFNVGWTGTTIYQTNAAGSDENRTQLIKDADDTGNIYKIDVVAGTVYYFSTSIVVDQTTLVISYSSSDASLKLTSNYEDGDVFVLNGNNLELTIDRQVTVDRSTISVNGGTAEEIASDFINAFFVNYYYYTINLGNLVSSLIDGGRLAVGDAFTITVEGIRDAANADVIYGETGNYSVTLTLGELPATLVSVNPADGSTIRTFYPEDGTEGFIVFTFSDPLNESKDNVNVGMSWGDAEAGSYEAYSPDFTIEGNTVTVDIRGIRIPEKVVGGRGSSGNTLVTMAISGLTTTDGRSISPNYTNAGTSAILVFYSVEKQAISFIYDFIPQSGTTSLEGYDEIVIWLNNPIIYDGVTVQWYNARGETVTRSFTPEDVPFEWDDYEEGYVAHLSLTGISYNTRPLTVTVDNAYLMNGDPVSIVGTFNTDASGISNAVEVDSDSVVKVYSIDGTFVREGNANSVLNGLDKGLYITGGKKVVVK